MKKVTMEDIARSLHISRVTVSKAMNNSPKVSSQLKEKIFQVAREMGYGQHWQKEGTLGEKPIVALAIAREESSAFWLNLTHVIAKELSKFQISLLYLSISEEKKSYVLPKELEDRRIKGMIVINVYQPEIYALLHTLEIPKVFLDTPSEFDLDTMGGDIVYIAGKRAVRQIVKDLIQRGHKEIGFIGDIHYATTNALRYEGFLEGMKGKDIYKDQVMTEAIQVGEYADKIYQFLRSLRKNHRLPSAFVCASDYVAQFVIHYLEAYGYEVPEHIAVTGFDGNREYLSRPKEFLTTVNVDLESIGKKLVRQLLARMDNPRMSYEISYVQSKISIGESSGM